MTNIIWKICIVDDEKQVAETIEKYLRRYTQGKDFSVSVNYYSGVEKFLAEYDISTDVVFMDIALSDGNGMDAVQRLREKDAHVAVLFVTNLAQYAVSGYSVNAFDFIVKPLEYESFLLKIKRLFQYLSSQKKCIFWVVNRSGRWKIDASTLHYVEIMRHQITYHTQNGVVVGSGTFRDVIERLEGLPFVQCNRCYLVNLSYVTGIADHEVWIGSDRLMISKRRYKEFLRLFNEYLSLGGGGGK